MYDTHVPEQALALLSSFNDVSVCVQAIRRMASVNKVKIPSNMQLQHHESHFLERYAVSTAAGDSYGDLSHDRLLHQHPVDSSSSSTTSISRHRKSIELSAHSIGTSTAAAAGTTASKNLGYKTSSEYDVSTRAAGTWSQKASQALRSTGKCTLLSGRQAAALTVAENVPSYCMSDSLVSPT